MIFFFFIFEEKKNLNCYIKQITMDICLKYCSSECNCLVLRRIGSEDGGSRRIINYYVVY